MEVLVRREHPIGSGGLHMQNNLAVYDKPMLNFPYAYACRKFKKNNCIVTL